MFKDREEFEKTLIKSIAYIDNELKKAGKKKRKKERCWEGYEPTPGKEPYSKDSCQPIKKEEVAPKGSNNRETYLEEFGKSDEIVFSFYNDGDLELEIGEDVEESIVNNICETLTKSSWTPKKQHKSKSGGLTQEGVESYRRANPGSKLKTAVTENKPKGKRAKRRKSFCARNKGQIDMHNINCKKTPEKRACLARRKWKCKN